MESRFPISGGTRTGWWFHRAQTDEVLKVIVADPTMIEVFKAGVPDTHRGLCGRVEAGRSAGGHCYGYDVVQERDGAGEPVRGQRLDAARLNELLPLRK